MYTRILAGVGAWLLGAGAATGGSLLAVSLIGRGIADTHSQQLTAAAVNRALASEAAEQSATPQATASPTPRPSPARTPASRAAVSPEPTGQAGQPGQAGGQTAQPGQTGQPGQSSDGTVLSSPGGMVVADCVQAGAYLVSWSPQQGYEISDVVRGPAASARLDFESQANSVTMVVTCSAGIPSARSYIHTGGDE